MAHVKPIDQEHNKMAAPRTTALRRTLERFEGENRLLWGDAVTVLSDMSAMMLHWWTLAYSSM